MFSFNGVFMEQMSNFHNMLKNGVTITIKNVEKLKIHVNTHAVITDEPGRAKICNF
jgi:hypothetical protein